MTTMTATEASRGFSTLLDRVSHGEEITITRDGEGIALISPLPDPERYTYKRIKERLAKLPRMDDDFARDVLEARDLVAPQEDPWGDDYSLDTTELIELERKGEIACVRDSDDIAIPTISLAEFFRGVENEKDPARYSDRLELYERIAGGDFYRVLPYTADTAREHGRLLNYVKRIGEDRGAHDLIVAAHARETGREILSGDSKARFGDLPGVSIAR